MNRVGSWLHGRGDALLTMLSGKTFSTPWPPPADRPRLARYRRHQLIYEGEHEQVYVGEGLGDEHGTYRYDEHRPYLIDNLSGQITKLFGDRLFGEGLRLKGPAENAEADSWLIHLAEASRFGALWPRLARAVSYRGDGWLKPIYDADMQDVIVVSVAPSITFVDTRSDDGSEIEQVTIAYVRWGEAKPYLFQEIHTRGEIAYRLYELYGNLGGEYGYTPDRDRVDLATLEDLAELPDEQETGIDELLMVHIGMGGSDDSGPWGVSDYVDIDSMQGELNNRWTQRGEVLDKHADPPVFGSPELLDEDGEVDIAGKFFPVPPGESPPGYVTWDGHLGPSENEISDLRLSMMRNAGASPESLMDSGGGAESGRALKLRQGRTGSSVRDRQQVYGPAIQKACSLASRLANSPVVGDMRYEGTIPELAPSEINLGWGDGLPDDTMQEIEEAGAEIQFGILSPETAIEQRHPDWDEERVQEELSRIAANRPGAVPAPGLNLGSEIKQIEAGGEK